MSQALRTAIVERLTGGVQGLSLGLDKLVARDPNDGANPAIFNGHKSQAQDVYDCLTYRLSGDFPDKRFRGVTGSGLSGRIYDVTVEMEFWMRPVDASGNPLPSADSAPIDRATGRLKALFDNQAFDVPAVVLPSDVEGEDDETDAGGRVVDSVCSTCQPDHYDKNNQCWFGLYRFHLRYQLA